jgi:hypothetical protein
MRTTFGGLIALMLLGIYAYAVIFAITVANCISNPECTRLTRADFTDGFAVAMSTVGGLVSALVIAELAVTKPGEAPVARALGAAPTPRATQILKGVTAGYIFVWVLVGAAAFITGVMRHPDVLQTLTDLGRTWLGLAVTTAYAFLGIKPHNSE